MAGYHEYKSCIDACLHCASICNHCASSCTQEDDVKMMARCIQFDMECAAICYAAAQLMSLGSERAMEFCRLCADICDACADECQHHQTGHCQECARACRACAEECRMMVGAAA
ncbi:MAG TPA: four-helix bundle copper-binding protein [Chitinophagaceae bacterium]|nr:four-helix bundle copper-binding protein [Chitinophagaceae bacterium]